MKFDPTISLGAVINLVGLAIIILGGFLRFDRRFTAMETKVNALWQWWMKNGGEDGPR